MTPTEGLATDTYDLGEDSCDDAYSTILAKCGSPLAPDTLVHQKIPANFISQSGYVLLNPEKVKGMVDHINSDMWSIITHVLVPGFRVTEVNGEEQLYMDLSEPYVATPSRLPNGDIKAVQLHSVTAGQIVSTKWLSSAPITVSPNIPTGEPDWGIVNVTPHCAGITKNAPLRPGSRVHLCLGLIAADVLAMKTGAPALGIVDQESYEGTILKILSLIGATEVVFFYDVMDEGMADIAPYVEVLRKAKVKVAVKTAAILSPQATRTVH